MLNYLKVRGALLPLGHSGGLPGAALGHRLGLLLAQALRLGLGRRLVSGKGGFGVGESGGAGLGLGTVPRRRNKSATKQWGVREGGNSCKGEGGGDPRLFSWRSVSLCGARGALTGPLFAPPR